MRLFFNDFMENIFSVKFILCSLSVVFVSLLCYNQDLFYIFTSMTNNSTTIIDMVDYLFGIGVFKNLILIIASIPFVEVFCNDWNYKNIYSVVTRCNVKKYSRIKLLSSVTGVIAVEMLGFFMLVLLLSFFLPLSNEQTINTFVTDKPFGLLIKDFPMLYLVLRVFVFALFSSLWVAVGLVVSTVIPDNFVALATPLISYYVIGSLCDGLPRFLNVNLMTHCMDMFGLNGLITFGYYLGFFLVVILIFTKVFSFMVNRRISNEFN